MKTTNYSIDEIKRFPTVTNPISADDLNTPQAYAYTLRRAIVIDCTDEQRAELVQLLNGTDTAEGVTFNNTKVNRSYFHRWQNDQSRQQRAAILGEGWQWIEGIHHNTKPGDEIVCIDGTRGRVTQSASDTCVIEFETEDGQRFSVAGYFRKEREITEAEGIKVGDKVKHNKHDEVATVTAIRSTFVRSFDGFRYVYTLDFGKSVKGAFGMEMNGGEYLREAFTKVSEQEQKPSAWLTEFSADDFQKLTAPHEVPEVDRDLIGCRFTSGEDLFALEVFVSDYAGNESHALIYVYEAFTQQVHANVLSLDRLRQVLINSNRWERKTA